MEISGKGDCQSGKTVVTGRLEKRIKPHLGSTHRADVPTDNALGGRWSAPLKKGVQTYAFHCRKTDEHKLLSGFDSPGGDAAVGPGRPRGSGPRRCGSLGSGRRLVAPIGRSGRGVARLVLALQAQGPADDRRPIVHIMLGAADWDVHPRRLRVDGPDDTREVLLSWFDNLPAGRLTAIYADGRRVDLLTLPASTGDAAAREALETAAR